jgi:hypothetical protein
MIGQHKGSSQSLKNLVAGFWFNCKKASIKKLGKNKSMQPQYTSVTLSVISTHLIRT